MRWETFFGIGFLTLALVYSAFLVHVQNVTP